MATKIKTSHTQTNITDESPMAQLLKKKAAPLVTLQKGTAVVGVVTKLTPAEILLDINSKAEAVVLEKDKKILRNLLRLLKVGDSVTATILNPESDLGHTVVSLRRFADDKLWEMLTRMQKDQEQVPVVIKEATRGGYLVETQTGVSGFLPNSHISFKQDTHDLVGQTITVLVFDINREMKKVIFSQKAVMGVSDFDAEIKTLKIGQKVNVIVSNVTSFGIFVSLPVPIKNGLEKFLDGLVHISEVSWDKIDTLSDMFTIGDTMEAVIVGFDKNAKRIDLSIKKLTLDPFEEAMKEYAVEQKITAIVSKIVDAGVLFTVGTGEIAIEGIMRKDKIPPTVSYEIGQKVTATISQIDTKKHRIVLLPVLLEKPLGYR